MEEIYEKLGLFYLGKDASDDSYTLYKSKHLTTHAMIVGMTGSGKTGLGIDILEEAAIDNIPSIVIDPKGDMGNLCLAFPDMKPEDFEPWIDKSDASNKGKSVKELAKDIAKMWKEGIKSFDQDISRVKKFADVEKTIYTPGSSAGVEVNVLGSFDAPSSDVLEDNDTFSSLINTTVSSLLALIGVDADPISSKEHLLLSNIFYHFWSKGISLNMEELIGYIATPPFKKIGMLQLQTFYPQKDRMKLAMALNGLISSISFSTWIKGEPLDIQNMLYDENGKAKIAIFSISHLNDNERMFFVTLLLNAFISWMRRQRGSSTLKAILYMDEIFGFFPPLGNPPSKEPMLLMLKQARAFGVGVVLSTQNPVDIDYKGLSNIGTWFVGKLQTKQDISKVIDGIASKSDMDKKELSEKISTLKGRHFYLKDVHEDETKEFYTRWVLSYLKGPMTKDDIKLLMSKQKMSLKKEEAPKQKEKKATQKRSIKPMINENIKECYNITDINSKEPFYPYLYAESKVRFYNQKRGIDEEEKNCLKFELDESVDEVCWRDAIEEEAENIVNSAGENVSYNPLPDIITQAKSLKEFEKKLKNYLYHEKKIELFVCKDLKIESSPHQKKRDFLVDIQNILKEKQDEEIEKLKKKYQSKNDKLEDKLKKLEMKLEKEKSDVSAKTTDTIINVGLTILGALFGSKKLSSTTIRRGASSIKKGGEILKEKNDVKNVESLMEEVRSEAENLEAELAKEIEKIKERYSVDNYEIDTISIKPRRSDIGVDKMCLLWER
ncbi:MAG: DUF87 domain-containing protein [Epsilonproteobacteria bacterium]|nr:DUF87 domain-containing protein [Campylobacterota bacterium]